MNEHELIRQPSLADQVLRILIDRINRGTYPPKSQLPPENSLAVELGVSRATIRHAYSMLEERNLVQRRRGIGTFVSKILSIANPLYQYIDFEDRIASYGHKPGFHQLGAKIVENGPLIAGKLDVEIGSRSLEINKIWTADDEMIVYIINHIPLWVFDNRLTTDEVLQPGITEPFFRFFNIKCNQKITHLSSAIYPCLVKDCGLPAEFESHDPNEPILLVEDIGFTLESRPAFHSLEHLFGIASRFETIRRVL